ncbi:MAG: hypothetical protein K5695_10955, partial [Oscillospiraceae bacterium]|nr:hypothetical protein [Oscillospiraceae bacterium]
MMKKRTIRMTAYMLALCCISGTVPVMNVAAADTAGTTVIYSSDFEDGDVSAWTNRGDRDTTVLTAS